MFPPLFTGLLAWWLFAGRSRSGDAAASPAAPTPSSASGVQAWFDLGVPRAGLLRVLPESNEHGFYADYKGDDAALLAEISRGLAKAGYAEACTAVDGRVRGFSNGHRQLALKIDLLPDPSLSLFDAEGEEPLLHGLCFGRYSEGPTHVLTQEEKEEFARDPEAFERKMERKVK